MGTITRNMPDADYRAIPRVSQSALCKMGRSPAHMKWAMSHPDTQGTDALRFGAAFHRWALEGVEPPVAPDVDRRTKDGKAEWQAFVESAGSAPWMTAEEHEAASGMLASMKAWPFVSALLRADGQNEVVFQWDAPVVDQPAVACKARIDKWIPGRFLMDLKTTSDASPWAFQRSAIKYNYHVQAAFYMDALKACGEKPVPYVLVAVEKEPPYGVSVVCPNAEAIVTGRITYGDWLRRYAECDASGSWPSYPHEITELELPPWATRHAADESHPF